jgi:GT2 family glycosyltransferase
VPHARIVHHKGVSSRARPIFVEWHKHRGMLRFYRKFFRHQYPGAFMWLVAVGVWLRFALVAAYSTGLRVRRALGRSNV